MWKHLSVAIFSHRWDLKLTVFTQNRGPWLETTGWLQGPLSLSSFRGRIKWIQYIFGDVVVKSKLSPHNGSSAFIRFNPINKMGHEVFFLIIFVLVFCCLNAFLWHAIAKRSLTKLLWFISFPVQNTVKDS